LSNWKRLKNYTSLPFPPILNSEYVYLDFAGHFSLEPTNLSLISEDGSTEAIPETRSKAEAGIKE